MRAGAAAPRRAAILAGIAASFVAAVHLLRALRPELLIDPEPRWAVPRLLLGLLAIALSAASGVCVAAGILLWSRHPSFKLFGPGRAGGAGRRFRIAPAGTAPGPGERLVERIRDGWGRDWGAVLGRRINPAAGTPTR